MVTLATLTTLEALKQEMAQSGRGSEEAALGQALDALDRPEWGFLTTGKAAERLGVSIPTIKRWIERGTLTGGPLGARWVVSQESVDSLVHLRESLQALDREGNPTPEEVLAMYAQSRTSPGQRRGTDAGA